MGLAVLGAVGRDNFGEIVFSAGCRFHGCSYVEEVEVHALSFGLNQARKMDMNIVQMETDYSVVVAAIMILMLAGPVGGLAMRILRI